MKIARHELSVSTRGHGLYDVTPKLRLLAREAGFAVGLAHVFVKHTSASLVIQENADPAVLRDLEAFMAKLAPESRTAYEHDDEGPDDMPAHIRSALTRTSETLPLSNGDLALGTWQALYLWEHRRAPHTRTLVVTLTGA